jgi:hypothetical protein
MLDRLWRRIGFSFLAAFGSKRAEGELNRMIVEDKLRSDWQVYLGETRAEPTIRNIMLFMSHRFGVDISEFVQDRPGRLNKMQQAEVMEELARILLARGQAFVD